MNYNNNANYQCHQEVHNSLQLKNLLKLSPFSLLSFSKVLHDLMCYAQMIIHKIL